MSTLTLFHLGLFVFFVCVFAALVIGGRALKGQPLLQRSLPVFITFATGAVMIVLFFIPRVSPVYKALDEFTQTWATIIVSFSVTLGIANLLYVNISKINKAIVGWGNNVVLLAGFLVMTWFGFAEGINGPNFDFLFVYVYKPMNTTMFSILAFYVASAAFRAFRAKNSEATLLLVAAVVVMLGRVSAGTAIWQIVWAPLGWFSPDLYQSMITTFDVSEIAIFINNVFTTAGQRAILLGASLGYISFSLKILLGIERSYFGGEA